MKNKVSRAEFKQIAVDYAERYGKEACWLYVLGGYDSADEVPESYFDIGVWAASIGTPTEIAAAVKHAADFTDPESVSARAWATRRPPPKALAKWGMQQSTTLAELADEVWARLRPKSKAKVKAEEESAT